MINVKDLAIPDVKLLMPEPHRDDRGYVAEIVNEKTLNELGLPLRFVQENQSLSRRKHTLRGMHFQKPPHAQAKLVRVLRGKAYDVAVDIRPHSPTFGKHAAALLSADELTQMLVPAGFAHGFCTLEDDTVILYKMSAFYAPAAEGGILWDDPDLNIQWPIDSSQMMILERDRKLPRLKDLSKVAW